MHDQHAPHNQTKPKRRWLQFSIRTVLLVVSLLCVALAVWVVPAERQRWTVAAIEKLDGDVGYRNRREQTRTLILRAPLPPHPISSNRAVKCRSTGGASMIRRPRSESRCWRSSIKASIT